MTYRTWMIAAIALVFMTGCAGLGNANAAAAETAAEDSSTPAADLSAAPSGAYRLDPRHGYIVFTYNHQGYSHPFVRWGRWDASLEWNAENPEASSVAATIEVNSIDTNVDKLDEHLRSADFFEAETYPEISFVSTGLTRTGANAGEMTGDLTVKGITKPVVLDVTLNNAGPGAEGSHKIGFSARGMVKRSDFGVDKYVPYVSDEVDLIIEAEFVSASAE